MKIRKYESLDRKSVEKIHFETGFLGKSMNKFLSNNNIWKQSIKKYFDSGNIYILEDKKVVGYLLGWVDENNDTKEFIIENLKNIYRILFSKDKRFWRTQLKNFFDVITGKSEERKLKIPKGAHLHINLLPEARNKGYGTKLLNKFIKDINPKVLYAISYETKINPNKNFWLKNGFKEYSKVKTTIWEKQLPKEKINLVCYVNNFN